MKHEGLIVGLIVVAAVISGVGLVLGVARPARQIRVVSATGTTQKSFVPDIAHLDLGVQTDAPTVQKAQQDNLATMNGVLATLKAAGVKSEDIQTSNFYINQNFDYASGKSAKPTGWHVSNTVTVRVKPEDMKAGLMKDAMANVRAKALGTLAGTIHTLGDIVSIAADWSGPSVVYAGRQGIGGATDYVTVETGTNIMSVSVSVSFELD